MANNNRELSLPIKRKLLRKNKSYNHEKIKANYYLYILLDDKENSFLKYISNFFLEVFATIRIY